MDPLATQIQQTMDTFNSFPHTPNFLIGTAIVGIGLLTPVIFRLFGNYFYIVWFSKWIPEQIQARTDSEKPVVEIVKDFGKSYFFLPFTSLTGPPDTTLRPLLALMLPAALLACGFLAIGLLIMVTDFLILIPIGFIGLLAICYGCFKLAIWQLKKDKLAQSQAS